MVLAKKDNTLTVKTDETTTILGRGSEFEGKLQFEGTLQIEGGFSGEILSDSTLVVLEGAKISAEVDIGTIIISGEVKGNIRAKNSVEIRSPGKVYGNIHTSSLTIEKGVIFEGTCKMENLSHGPKVNPPSFSAPPPKKAEPANPKDKE